MSQHEIKSSALDNPAFDAMLAECDPRLGQLARELFAGTKTPQAEGSANEAEISAHLAPHTRALQAVLQDALECSAAASRAGINLALHSRPPVNGTPTGDFFRVVKLTDGRLSIFVGDAVGHNSQEAWDNSLRFNLFTRSAFFMDNAYGGGADARSVLNLIDQHCNFRGSGAADAVVASHVLIDPRTGKIEFANAGNAQYLAVLEKGGSLRYLRAGGAPLANPAMFQYLDSEPDLITATVAPGDVMIVTSDGVPDGAHHSGATMSEKLPEILERINLLDPLPDQALGAVLSEMESTFDDLCIAAFAIAN